ncbi:hypothetical protein QYM36_019058 [Artemia franciscana]|uniref:Uncharacterized protein n=1 Tax=Artemia franciscana TaxID=6661 RepID=A0AA88HB72_ARTSF|nr:hypothetical protein QYM36_019058 [Artemia franciscana]
MIKLILFIICFVSEKLNAGVINSLKEDLLEASFSNVTSDNMRDVWFKSIGEMSRPFKELRSDFELLAIPFNEKLNFSETFTVIESVVKNTEMILSEVFQNRSTYFKNQTNDPYCILKENLLIMGYQNFVLNFQKDLVNRLTQLGKEVSPLLIKYFEITWNDDSQNAENLQRILEEIKIEAKLIILLEDIKSEEGKEKMLTRTCSQNNGEVSVEERIEAQFSEKGTIKDDIAGRPIAENGNPTKRDNATLIEIQEYYTTKNVVTPSHEMTTFNEHKTLENNATLQQILPAFAKNSELPLANNSYTNGNTKKNINNSPGSPIHFQTVIAGVFGGLSFIAAVIACIYCTRQQNPPSSNV